MSALFGQSAVRLALINEDVTNSKFFRSTVIESMNALRADVAALRTEVKDLRARGVHQQSSVVPARFCCLYVRVLHGGIGRMPNWKVSVRAVVGV